MAKKHQIKISAKATRSKACRSWRRAAKQADGDLLKSKGKKRFGGHKTARGVALKSVERRDL